MDKIKELDCVLIEGKDDDGLILKFTLRGEGVQELKDKVDKVKELWFPTFVAKVQPQVVAQPTKKAWTGGFKKQEAGEMCNKCGVAKIILNPNTGKTFCEAKCWLNTNA